MANCSFRAPHTLCS